MYLYIYLNVCVIAVIIIIIIIIIISSSSIIYIANNCAFVIITMMTSINNYCYCVVCSNIFNYIPRPGLPPARRNTDVYSITPFNGWKKKWCSILSNYFFKLTLLEDDPLLLGPGNFPGAMLLNFRWCSQIGSFPICRGGNKESLKPSPILPPTRMSQEFSRWLINFKYVITYLQMR